MKRSADRPWETTPGYTFTVPNWPPGFVPTMPDRLREGAGVHASLSALERSQQATRFRDDMATFQRGWGSGQINGLAHPAYVNRAPVALARPAEPAPPNAAPTARTVHRRCEAAARDRDFAWRGHSVGYRAWVLLKGGARLSGRELASALELPASGLRNLLNAPLEAKVLVVKRTADGVVYSRGPVVPDPPISTGTRLRAQ